MLKQMLLEKKKFIEKLFISMKLVLKPIILYI